MGWTMWRARVPTTSCTAAAGGRWRRCSPKAPRVTASRMCCSIAAAVQARRSPRTAPLAGKGGCRGPALQGTARASQADPCRYWLPAREAEWRCDPLALCLMPELAPNPPMNPVHPHLRPSEPCGFSIQLPRSWPGAIDRAWPAPFVRTRTCRCHGFNGSAPRGSDSSGRPALNPSLKPVGHGQHRR